MNPMMLALASIYICE